jgi:alpha-methylacyl-CoA racemase
MSGPLSGLRIVEMVGLGPAPFGAMLLADMGAEVIRIDRPGGGEVMKMVAPRFDTMARGRRSVAVDLKKPGAAELVLELVGKADAILEGFRPGVMERLGLGPDVCLAGNPRLVYGRMTGYGQSGPLSQAAGHDINYIALSGLLNTIGRPDQPPVLPVNYLGDMGGGGLMLAFGVVCALLEARHSGQGQVVDASMVEGSALLSTMIWGFQGAGIWAQPRGMNFADGGAFYNRSYETADGKHVAIASVEPQFYKKLCELAGLDESVFRHRDDPRHWPDQAERLASLFKTRTRDQWCALMEGSDVCFAPVLDWDEAPRHPHNRAREVFIDVAGVTQPAPAPRFSRTAPARPAPPSAAGADTDQVLEAWGIGADTVGALKAAGVVCGPREG